MRTLVPGCDARAAQDALAAIHAYRARDIDHDEGAARLYDGYARAVRGTPVAVLRQTCAEAWQRSRGRLFPHVQDLIALLRARDLSLCLLSGSPHEAVLHAARDLGIDHAWGLLLATDGDRCTERILRAPARAGAKRDVLREATAGLHIDWERSFAIGDSASDADVLDMVGHPVAYEPDPQLLATSIARGWTVTDRETVLQRCRSLWDED
jgi:phosphoserine phosphatase